MAVKYQCPKCDKRFVEWGAEKLGFKCPDCDEPLVRSGAQPTASAPTLKRRAKKAAAVRVPSPVIPALDMTPTGEDDLEVEADEVEEVAFGEVPVVDDEDAAVITPAVVDDEDADEDAHGEETPEVLDFDADAAPIDDAILPEFEEEH